MLESIQNENLEYQRLSPDEMKARGILGRLVGVCADFTNPTRNGRLYSEELWEKVFDDPIMKERIQNGVCYGELGHPSDREETDMEKIAVCLSDVPKKGKDGKLRAVFDILDTPNGRVLKSLCDYGSTLGISSRGSGDLVKGFDGQEEVDPSSYSCEGFDVVLIPAVKDARLKYVTESLDKKRYNKTLRQKLQESLDKASPHDRKLMEEGLDRIGIVLNEAQSFKSEMDFFDEMNSDIVDDNVMESIDEKDDLVKDTEVDNNESALINELQESVAKAKVLRRRVMELQEKLSVCYSKESAQEEKINSLKEKISKLSKSSSENDALTAKIKSLTEDLKKERLVSTKRDAKSKELSSTLTSVVEKYNRLVDVHNELKEDYKHLNEQLSESQKLQKEYVDKINNSNALVEKYRKAANSAAEKYIESQAVRVGVTSQEIKNKLPEKYNFDDIDRICEGLARYNLNISNLPFKTSRKLNENIKLEATSSKEPILPDNGGFDDNVDDLLRRLSGLNK